MSGMRSLSLGPRSRAGLEGTAGERFVWPVVLIWVTEGTRPPKLTVSLSLPRGCQQPGGYTGCPLCGCEGLRYALTLSCGPPHPWTEARRRPCGWALRTCTGGDELLCRPVRTSAFELDPSAVCWLCDPGQATWPLCASVSPALPWSSSNTCWPLRGELSDRRLPSRAQGQVLAKGSRFRFRAGRWVAC